VSRSARVSADDVEARRFRIRGVVQGVGFRPFVFRLATTLGLAGWVVNDGDGVLVHVEGGVALLDVFKTEIARSAPEAARIAGIDAVALPLERLDRFEIRESASGDHPTAHISPDLPLCDDCRRELRNPWDRRYGYPYINCTNCGPRYSIVLELPYDRPSTTMRAWPMCEACRREYDDPGDRRFHAQPVACPRCGPQYRLAADGKEICGPEAMTAAAGRLRLGAILAIKGVGGYHLACDARNATAVEALRERKFRKERPFAVMVRDLQTFHDLVDASSSAETLALSAARPIVIASARHELPGVAPGMADLGVMLPYAPVHELLFDAGAPAALVLTSGNRSSEPIAFEDDDAASRLTGLADAFLIGERLIARRVDDSVVMDGPLGPVIVRRSRGHAPAAVTGLPVDGPLLALGGDLKNAVTLVVDGTAFVSQHIGDLDHHSAGSALTRTIEDLLRMYAVDRSQLVVAHDVHPGYRSTAVAESLGSRRLAIQHHRAHVASVLAEREALDVPVIGVAFDGTGYGDDGTIWGGEIFAGSVGSGLARVAHLRHAWLPGGDAAARFPAQALAGFVYGLPDLGDLTAPPFNLPARFALARRLAASGVRTFGTTSVGRLFDAVAAALGFTRPVSFEGQAAMWLEQQARRGVARSRLRLPTENGVIDFRHALTEIIHARRRGEDPADIARAFHEGLVEALVDLVTRLASSHGAEAVVLSGGVFQNMLLLRLTRESLPPRLSLWTNREVPPNDGGISLGQAAIAACTADLRVRRRECA